MAAFVVLAVVFFALFGRPASPYGRQTIVVVGSPMVVLSWNSQDGTATMVTLPSDVAAEGTHGYGMYSLEAFWRLGQIDKKDGTVLSESLSETLGVPVPWYIGAKNGVSTHDASTPDIVKQTFSLQSVTDFLRGAYRTNMPFSQFVRFAWLFTAAKPQRVLTFDYRSQPDFIAEQVTLPDGSMQWVLDPARLDVRLAHVFEDERIRRESVTVAVLNTTSMPSLGSRAARFLTNIGVSVVSVGNDTPEADVCTIAGSQAARVSVSAKVIASVFGCIEDAVTPSDRADLTVRIGKSYTKRFIPN